MNVSKKKSAVNKIFLWVNWLHPVSKQQSTKSKTKIKQNPRRRHVVHKGIEQKKYKKLEQTSRAFRDKNQSLTL